MTRLVRVSGVYVPAPSNVIFCLFIGVVGARQNLSAYRDSGCRLVIEHTLGDFIVLPAAIPGHRYQDMISTESYYPDTELT